MNHELKSRTGIDDEEANDRYSVLLFYNIACTILLNLSIYHRYEI